MKNKTEREGGIRGSDREKEIGVKTQRWGGCV